MIYAVHPVLSPSEEYSFPFSEYKDEFLHDIWHFENKICRNFDSVNVAEEIKTTDDFETNLEDDADILELDSVGSYTEPRIIHYAQQNTVDFDIMNSYSNPNSREIYYNNFNNVNELEIMSKEVKSEISEAAPGAKRISDQSLQNDFDFLTLLDNPATICTLKEFDESPADLVRCSQEFTDCSLPCLSPAEILSELASPSENTVGMLECEHLSPSTIPYSNPSTQLWQENEQSIIDVISDNTQHSLIQNKQIVIAEKKPKNFEVFSMPSEETIDKWLEPIPVGTRLRGPSAPEYLMRILSDAMEGSQLVQWENKNAGVFRLLNSKLLAKIWGKRKTHKNKPKTLSKEHFARNLRYHYRKGGKLRPFEKQKVYKFTKSFLDEWGTRRS